MLKYDLTVHSIVHCSFKPSKQFKLRFYASERMKRRNRKFGKGTYVTEGVFGIVRVRGLF